MSDMERLNRAVVEAQRFLTAAHILGADTRFKNYPTWPNPKRSAAKRASMDLTRALADFRRPL